MNTLNNLCYGTFYLVIYFTKDLLSRSAIQVAALPMVRKLCYHLHCHWVNVLCKNFRVLRCTSCTITEE